MSSSNLRQARMEANLGALAAVQRAVAERLCGPVVDDHLTHDEAGGAVLQHRTNALALTLDESTRSGLISELEEGEAVFLFGAGDAQLLSSLLDAGHTVALWDRDLALIRFVFYELELFEALLEGRLRIYMGVDCLDVVEQRDQYQLVAHPLLFALYASEALLWELGLPSKLVCMCTGGLFIHDVAESIRDLGYGVLPCLLYTSPSPRD